jgi:hypothetical protein
LKIRHSYNEKFKFLNILNYGLHFWALHNHMCSFKKRLWSKLTGFCRSAFPSYVLPEKFVDQFVNICKFFCYNYFFNVVLVNQIISLSWWF